MDSSFGSSESDYIQEEYRHMFVNEQLQNGLTFNFAAWYGISDNVIHNPINFIDDDIV